MMQNKVLGTLAGIVSAILLGVLGSAIWELILRPIVTPQWLNLISIATLGISSIQNGVYRGVATGFDPKLYTSTYYLLQEITLITISIAILASFSGNKIEQILQRQVIGIKLKYSLAIVLFAVAISIFIIWSLEVYESEAVSHIQQALTICSPYMSEEKVKEINSEIARIDSRNDYVVLEKKLREIADKQNIEIPNFNIW